MYSLTVVFGPQSTTWTLLFDSHEAAVKAHNLLVNDVRTSPYVEDDYGQTITVLDIPHAVMLEDLDRSRQVHVITALHQAKIMAASEKAAREDVELQGAAARARAATIAAGRMPMVTPRIG